jgi:hypothetical protein
MLKQRTNYFAELGVIQSKNDNFKILKYQGCQIFRGTKIGIFTKRPQMAIIFTKLPLNRYTNSFNSKGQIGIFGKQIYHLAILLRIMLMYR